jgi:UDP:flavonoid glycosyltransferase YjiC (YdhE family)
LYSANNINELDKKPAILVAPLDWGLGHATRLIPIIKFLENKKVNVILAASGRSRQLLKEEFPALPILDLPSYNIRYSKNASLTGLKLLAQIPHASRVMRKENKLLEKYIREFNLKAVISDNRPGLYSCEIPCVYITHQIEIKTGVGWLDRIASIVHQKWIRNFDTCWIPDKEANGGLAGALSHPQRKTGFNYSYIGCLSRYPKIPPSPKTTKLKLLFMLSGPEPQRSILEQKLLDQSKGLDAEIDIVRGLPGEKEYAFNDPSIRFFNHLPAEQLGKLIAECTLVVARSGYSTAMDLAMLQKKAILIPTPGQAEQTYLSEYYHKNKFFHCAPQTTLDLKKEIEACLQSSYVIPDCNGLEEKVIEAWLKEKGLIS